MTDSGWSPAGIASAIAIVAGIVLLILYAVRRGLVVRELDGTDDAAAAMAADDPTASRRPVARSRAGRPLGALGALLLVVGLALGALTAMGTWGAATTGGGPGQPTDCAQGWNGCPATTLKP